MTQSGDKATGAAKPVTYVLFAVLGVILGGAGTYFFLGARSSSRDAVVAEYNGKSIRAADAFGPVKNRLYELEEELYRTKEQAINEFIDQKLLEAESKKQNLPLEQLIEKETGGGADQVTDKEISDFLASKGISQTDPRVRTSDVRDYLIYRKRFDKRQNYVAKLRAGAKVKMLVKEPEPAKVVVNTEGYPSWGNSKAPVTIVEFSDFACPYCGKAVDTIDKIKQEFGPDKVRIIFRDMPLPMHARAMPASLAAHCANEQGKFWEYHNTLFHNQQKLEDTDLKDYAKQASLDVGKFNQCFESKKYSEVIEKSRKEAEQLSISATPSFVINGVLLQGAQPFERFKEKIERAMRG